LYLKMKSRTELNMARQILGIDTGGTFTDFVLYDNGELRIHKVLSSPHAPEQAILQGITELGLELQNLKIVHGSTIATNAVLEGKGARTVFITNHGLGDMLSIGRQARRELYNLQPQRVPPPVAAEFCLETGGRQAADGEVLEDLSDEDLDRLREQVDALSPESVAINLLFSFLNDRFEKAIEAAMPDDVFVARSSSVLPEYREYERGITTWLNAYVGPLVQGYLARLEQRLSPAALTIMQSSGETCGAEQAGQLAVHLLLSGPAGGLQGAGYISKLAGCEQLLTLDMGGTSTDVAVIAGELTLTSEGHIAGYPVAVPMVDMHTIGAGGGSIASVDAGGLLQVGPQSAGADPGPACYARGGENLTVTDANLLLGRIPPQVLLGGSMPLDRNAAQVAAGKLLQGLDLDSVEALAEGVIRLANEHMAAALRVITVQRGLDPREFVLTCFGGAGGMHVCELAEALEIKRAMIPIQAGVLSALGMLVAPPGRQLSRTLKRLLDACTEADLQIEFERLREIGEKELHKEGISDAELIELPSLDLCYRGQSFSLNIPWRGISQATEAFHLAHQQRYGHRLEMPVEVVNVRLGLRSKDAMLSLAKLPPMAGPQPVGTTRIHRINEAVPVWQRTDLPADFVIKGPAVILEQVSTTWLAPGWVCRVDEYGKLCLEWGVGDR
jgi:N-methylhydantoinase A